MSILLSYLQAKADHKYLWSIGAAYDMTGGYEDQDDLATLLANPNKATAVSVFVRQIEYWFLVGPDTDVTQCNKSRSKEALFDCLNRFPNVDVIRKRYSIHVRGWDNDDEEEE